MPTPYGFKANATRYDPYKNFRFRVKWGDTYVAGVSKIGALTRTTQVVSHREGGDPSTPRKSPGQSDYAAIVLERGVAHDPAFVQWANKVWDYQSSTGTSEAATGLVSLSDFRKDIIIELYNESGQKVVAYNVYRCWVSEFTALPELDANANAVAIQSIKLENEGWDQDATVTEPTEAATGPRPAS